jgi:hypothetical protein
LSWLSQVSDERKDWREGGNDSRQTIDRWAWLAIFLDTSDVNQKGYERRPRNEEGELEDVDGAA